jgi:predicted helicase
MREELMKSFDEIYILNLHGSALLGETAPDGGPDENVFDIRQGVAITLAVRGATQTSEITRTSKVYYADLWGPRQGKYRYLLENDVSATDWQMLAPGGPCFFFIPKDFDLLSEYERGCSVIKVFQSYSTGFETGRDHELISFTPDGLIPLVSDLADANITDEDIAEKYGIGDTSGWPVSQRRRSLTTEGLQKKYLRVVSYRPFDWRYTYYHDFLRRAQLENLRHLCQPNVALITSRIIKGEEPKHVFVSADPLEKIFLSPKTSNNAFVFPLYLYSQGKKEKPRKGGGSVITQALFESRVGYASRDPNLSPKFIAAVKEKLGLGFVPDGKGDLQTTFGPEDVFHYAYAVFHSPTYRARYAEFLKIDFPRLPLTSDRGLFKTLAGIGEELVALHLMKSPALNTLITRFPVAGSNEVTRVNYVAPHQDAQGNPVPGRVYINREQYFEGSISPEVWEFHVGGYQVLHKWLKDRTGRKLSFDDLLHYQKVVVALKETIRLMDEIDRAIPAWPIE